MTNRIIGVVIDGGYLTAAEWTHPGHTKFMDQ